MSVLTARVGFLGRSAGGAWHPKRMPVVVTHATTDSVRSLRRGTLLAADSGGRTVAPVALRQARIGFGKAGNRQATDHQLRRRWCPGLCDRRLPLLLVFAVQGKDMLEVCGHIFGAGVLQLSLLADVFILLFTLLLWVWPKGGAVAQAAFREGIRQPLFWLIFIVAFVLHVGSPRSCPTTRSAKIYLMVKELGYDTIMLAAAVFGALAASLSISEEIEGRTAVTLMSKPVSRRQFLLGKFVGILLATLLMIGLLGSYFEGSDAVQALVRQARSGADRRLGHVRRGAGVGGRGPGSRPPARRAGLGRPHVEHAARACCSTSCR